MRFTRCTHVMTYASEEEIDDHDRGLAFDLAKLVDRRRALQLLAGAGLVTFAAACGSKGNSDTSARSDATSTTAIPEETAGPFPGDGSNGPNVLNESAIVRRDIRSSFGSYSGTAEGVPL